MARSVASPVVWSDPWVRIFWIICSLTPSPSSLLLLPIKLLAIRSANAAREPLNPMVLALATLSPITERSVVLPSSPVAPVFSAVMRLMVRSFR
jgi:hypothetical protein